MSSTAKHWILKVVSGPHQGAEIRLPEGRSLVGSDEECDVVLRDVLVAPQHFSLDLTQDVIKVTPLGGRLYCDGAWMKESEVQIDPFSFLTAGGTHLIIGPSDQPWPALSFSDVPEIIKDPKDSLEGSGGGADEGTDDEQQGENREPNARDEAVESENEAEEAKPQIEDSVKRRKQALAGIGFGVLLLLIWFVVVKQYRPRQEKDPNESSASSRQSESVEEKKTRLEEFIAELGLSETLIVNRRGDILEVDGYVPSDDQLMLFRQSIGENFNAVFPRVRSLEMIEASANAIITGQGLDLLAEVESDGSIQVSGVILPDSEEKWKLAMSQLESIPGVKSGKLKPNVKIAAPRALEIPSPDPRSNASETPSPDLGSNLRLSDGASPASPVIASGGAGSVASENTDSMVDVIGVREDGFHWVRLKNGDVFFKGARIPSGGTIEEILPEEVIISDRGTKRRVKNGEKIW